MTREEAISCLEICKKYIDKIRASEGVEVSKELCMALDMAIKSLEQEPCEDCVSIQAVMELLNKRYCHKEPYEWKEGNATYKSYETYYMINFDKLKALPSVLPKREQCEWRMIYRHHHEVKKYTGIDLMGDKHTIYVNEEYEGKEPYCPKCGKRADDLGQRFCGYCGVRIVESQESEAAEQ